MVDKLNNGQLLFVCEASQRGTWMGVVYASGDDDCGVTSPIQKERTYIGPCKVGWVNSAWVEILAD